MIKILDRYLARELIGPFFFGCAFFLIGLSAGDFWLQMRRFVPPEAPGSMVLLLLALRTAKVVPAVLPMAMLLAAFLCTARLARDSEVTALQASGVSRFRIARVPLMFGVLVSIVGMFAHEYLTPIAGQESREMKELVISGLRRHLKEVELGNYQAQDWDNGELRRVVLARAVDARTGVLTDLTCLNYRDNGLRTVVQAEQAAWLGTNRWQLTGIRTTVLDGKTEGRAGEPGSSLVQTLDVTPGDLLRDRRKPDELGFRDFSRYIEKLRADGASPRLVRELEIALHSKLAFPAASLPLAFLGTVLAMRREQIHSIVGFIVSVAVVLGYYGIWQGMSLLAINGAVSPVIAAWSANVVGVTGGLAAMFRRNG